MKIGVFNKKGGVGKSPISFLIAKELKLPIISNDDSDIDSSLVIYQDIIDTKNYDDVVIDMGGWIDINTLDVLKECDIVLIPFNSKPNSIKRTKNLILELETLNIGYNLLFTQFTTEREKEKIIEDFAPKEIDYFFHNTKMLDIMIKNNFSIEECLNSNKSRMSWFKNHAKAFKIFINDLKDI